MSDETDDALQNKLEQAFSLQQNAEVVAAQKLFSEVLVQFPTQPDALHGMGLCLAQQRQFAEAIPYFKAAIQAAPAIPEFHNNLGNAYKAVGMLNEALRHYTQALRLKANYPQAQNNLGTLLYQLGKYEEASAHFQKSLRMDPQSVDTHYNLANCYIQLDRFLDAATHYEAVLKLRPDHLGATHNLGITYCTLKRFPEAQPLLIKVLAREPENIDALFHLGVIYSALANAEQAKVCYEKVLALDPQQGNSHHNLATIYLHLGQQDKALEHYQQALKLQPENKTAQHMVAALSGQTLASGAPPEYTRALFDQYAYSYDQHVKEQLKYQVPHLLRDAISPYLSQHENTLQILDLGCGTGLCAPLFADITDKITGVDVSPNMIEVARQGGGYSKLFVADILTFLTLKIAEYDLILAADVFVYFGSLQEVFAASHRALKEKGLFCFSIELSHEAAEFSLRKTGRYIHQSAYIAQLSVTQKFKIEYESEVVIRYQEDEPVRGKIFILRK